MLSSTFTRLDPLQRPRAVDPSTESKAPASLCTSVTPIYNPSQYTFLGIETEQQQPPMDQQQQQQAEIAFFDVETTVPIQPGSGYSLLEFGAILVCSKRLVEVDSYSTLIRPSDLGTISTTSVRCNGITKEMVANAPLFSDVADQIYTILHGRVWAGHNIVRFDCARVREAFAEIGRPAPEAKGMVDTLPLLTQRFGRRAGDMKMASLATYFGLGHQKHRSLEDVRMNLEVLKYCATVLFLESTLPDVFPVSNLIPRSSILRNPNNENGSSSSANSKLKSTSLLSSNLSVVSETIEVCAQAEPSAPVQEQNSDLVDHIEQMTIDSSQRNAPDDENPRAHSPETASIVASVGPSGSAGFLEPDEVSVDSINASQVPFHYKGQRMHLLHRDVPLQIGCSGMRVQFGVSAKYVDCAGRPKLSIVVNVPTSLSRVLDACDRVAQSSSVDSGSSSEWNPVIRKSGYTNTSSARLHIPTIANGESAVYSTEIYKKEASAADVQKLIFSRLDTAVLEQLFVPGTIVDAYFSVDVYDYQQNAGIRLVAKRLVVHPM